MPGKNILYLALIFIPIVLGLSLGHHILVYATESDEELEKIAQKLAKKEKEYKSTSQKLSDIRSQKDSISKKISQLSGQLTVTQVELADIQSDINKLEVQLAEINKNLTDRKTALQGKIDLRNKVLRNYSKRAMLNDLEVFFADNGFEYSALAQIYSRSVTSEAVRLIGVLNTEINSFEKDKAEGEKLKGDLQETQNELVALKQQLENQKNSAQTQHSTLAKQEGSLEDKLSDLQQEINELSAKQQQILNEKSGDSSSSVGDYESPEASLPDPSFSPAFAAISFGAFTHGNGMSQYGAKGRALAGQDYKAILNFYYKVGVKKDDNFPSKIAVKGYGTMDYQKYLYGIAEMPSDWPSDALKAQAIAARTYASRTGKPICTTEACQVFLKSKSDNPPAAWKKAVDDSKNMILDNPSTSQYSSTTGGYISNIGWDTSGSWPSSAYEKKAGSPWFYKAWYTKSYSPSSDKCGRSSPWLKESEMVDILNAWVVWEKGSSSDRKRISPITTSCWGGSPYSINDMADRAAELGDKFTSVSAVDSDVVNGGYTGKIKFETNNGTVTIDGLKFKTVFNLRAPGYISIKNKLFEVIRK